MATAKVNVKGIVPTDLIMLGCINMQPNITYAKPFPAINILSLSYNFSLSILFTSAGLALPCMAFMTCPTKKANILSLPLRYCST